MFFFFFVWKSIDKASALSAVSILRAFLHSDYQTKEALLQFYRLRFQSFFLCFGVKEKTTPNFWMKFQLPIFCLLFASARRQSTCRNTFCSILFCSTFYFFHFPTARLSEKYFFLLFLDRFVVVVRLACTMQRIFFKLKIKCISLSSSREFVQIN